MSSADSNLARVHALHRQFFGDQALVNDPTTRPQTAHGVIPPLDDEGQIVLHNPFPAAQQHHQHNAMPIAIPTRVPNTAWRYADPAMPFVEPSILHPIHQNVDAQAARRAAPAAGLFRQVDWRADRAEVEVREQGATLKRAPSASSSASGNTKVKAQKENGIFRKTSQRCGKFTRAVTGRSRRPSGSDMMEGVEVSAPTPESAIPSVAAHKPGTFFRLNPSRISALTKAPRHDTPQPVNGELSRNTPVVTSSPNMPAHFIHRHAAPQFPQDTIGGDAARRAAAATNGARYPYQSAPMARPEYQLRRDSYRRSISSLPTASDSGADLVSGADMDLMDIEKAGPVKLDPVAALPTEIVTLIFSHLDAPTLKACRGVTKGWAAIAIDPLIWRGQYLQHFQKEVYVEPAPIQIGGTGTGRPKEPIQKWELMFDARKKLNQNWARGEAGGKAVYLSGHTDSVYCVQFDENKIITGSRDRTIRVWDINTFKCLKVIGGPTVKPSPGPKRLRTVDPSKLLGTVDSVNGTREGDEIYHIPTDFHSASILCLQYDDEILVTGSSDNDLLVWDIKTFQPIRRLKHHGGGVLDVAFDSKHIVSCSKDCTIVVWDRKTLQPVRALTGHRGPVNAVQLRGHLLVSASGDGVARLWDLNKMECIREFPQKERGLAAVEFSDDAKYVLAGGNDHTTYKFDVATGAEVKTFTGHTQLVRSLFLDTQNRRVVSGSYDLDLRVYDYDSGKLLGRFAEWTTSWMLAAKSDYRRIVSTSQDGRILVIDFGRDEHGREIHGVDLLASEAHPTAVFQ